MLLKSLEGRGGGGKVGEWPILGQGSKLEGGVEDLLWQEGHFPFIPLQLIPSQSIPIFLSQ